MYPTTDELQRIRWVTPEKARRILFLMELLETSDYQVEQEARKYPAVDTWMKTCHHAPLRSEVIMEMIDEELDTEGIQSFERPDARGDGRYSDHIDYCNTGDPYDLTVCYDYRHGEFLVASWGGILEDLEGDGDESDEDDE